jgi:hypothetical protein
LDELRTGGTYQLLGKGEAVVVRWRMAGDTELMLAANLRDSSTPGFAAPAGRVIWREGEAGDSGIFGPFAVRWSIDEKEPEHHG